MIHSRGPWYRLLLATGMGLTILLILLIQTADHATILAFPEERSIGHTHDEITITVFGPDTVLLHEVVTYSIHYTVSLSYLGIEYLFPSGFSILQTDPLTSSSNIGVLRWGSDKINGRHILTVTGQYKPGGCSPAIHTASFFDPYNSQLPMASKTSTVSGWHCIFLPLTLQNHSLAR